MKFYLGTHRPHWLGLSDVPWFVSDTTLRTRKTLPRALGRWALDSGGYTELQRHGEWTSTPDEYIARVRRYRDEIGGLDWACPQDWMCDPLIIEGGWRGKQFFVGTHLSVLEHQRRTVDNLLELRAKAPDLPFAPVLQGDRLPEYLRCADLYATAGIDLTTEPVVALGSIAGCQDTAKVEQIVEELGNRGIRNLHGLGVKMGGVTRVGAELVSADSMAWSLDARWADPLPGCTHAKCSNCLDYALAWRRRLLAAVPDWSQQSLFAVADGR